MKEFPPALGRLADAQPYPLLFVTVGGTHLYGFPARDSIHELRGVHVLPLREVVGLTVSHETIEVARAEEGPAVELVTHDVRKFFSLLLKRNSYALEQLFSPLVLRATPELEEMRAIGRGCITRHHAQHYLGLAHTQWGMFAQERPRRAKTLLYVYRMLLTGIHLMRTGQVEANLPALNKMFQLPYIDELVERKLAGGEKGRLEDDHVSFHELEFARLTVELEQASRTSNLPEEPTSRLALNDLLVRLRLHPHPREGARGG